MTLRIVLSTSVQLREHNEAVSDAHKWLSPISHVSPEPVYNSQMFDLLSLPKPTIDIFTGDPLAYKEVMAIFDDVVDSRPVDTHIKLSTLLQFTSGGLNILSGTVRSSAVREDMSRRVAFYCRVLAMNM